MLSPGLEANKKEAAEAAEAARAAAAWERSESWRRAARRSAACRARWPGLFRLAGCEEGPSTTEGGRTGKGAG
eukprot:5502229-Alexandrium_andersonii.AAC.1